MNLEDLVKRIKTEGGWELYHHAAGRGDLNDTGNEDCYVRAYHNVWNPTEDSNEGSSFRTALRGYGDPPPLEKENDFELVLYGSFPKRRTINQLINTSDGKKAYYIRLEIKAEVPDERGRCDLSPSLTIVSSQEVIQEIISYLKKKPSNYYNLIDRLVTPKGRYKNVRVGILDKVEPASNLLLLDTDKVLRGEGDRIFGRFSEHRNIQEKYGQLVKK